MHSTTDLPATEDGYVYLLHFQRPISPDHTTQHYTGYADDLATRIQVQEHGGSNAARLLQVAKERHIPFTVARVWRGGRTLERQLKNRKSAPRLCPICHPETEPGPGELTIEQIQNQLIAF